MQPERIRRILVIKWSALGDVVIASAVMEDIARAFPRATLHLVRAAKAVAAISGRDYVLPDDVLGITQPVLAHRLLPNVEATMTGRSTSAILSAIVESVPVPTDPRA